MAGETKVKLLGILQWYLGEISYCICHNKRLVYRVKHRHSTAVSWLGNTLLQLLDELPSSKEACVLLSIGEFYKRIPSHLLITWSKSVSGNKTVIPSVHDSRWRRNKSMFWNNIVNWDLTPWKCCSNLKWAIHGRRHSNVIELNQLIIE